MQGWLAKSIFQLGNKSHSSGTKYMGEINNGNYLQMIKSEPVKLQNQYGRFRALPESPEVCKGETSMGETKREN
jgi:hypothetical protein